jgi:hypothetical protein
MKTSHSSRARVAFLGLAPLVVTAFVVAPACGNNNNAAPPTPTSTATASSSGSQSGASTSTSSTSGGGGAGGAGSSTASSSSGGTGGGDGGPPCVSDGGATGCYSCPPQTNSQFLNACASATDQCTHFNNVTRLPFYDGGTLPPAP